MSNLKTYSFHSRFALAALKVSDFASEETLCFQATILLDGKKVGTVSNDGHGGCDRLFFSDKAARALFTEEAAKLPPYDGYDGKPLSRGVDGFTEWLLNEFEMRKLAKKYLAYLPAGVTEPTPEVGIIKRGRKRAAKDDVVALRWLETNEPDATLIVA